MEGFLHAVSSVTIILLLTATGYFCAAKGWMGPQAKAFYRQVHALCRHPLHVGLRADE